MDIKKKFKEIITEALNNASASQCDSLNDTAPYNDEIPMRNYTMDEILFIDKIARNHHFNLDEDLGIEYISDTTQQRMTGVINLAHTRDCGIPQDARVVGVFGNMNYTASGKANPGYNKPFYR